MPHPETRLFTAHDATEAVSPSRRSRSPPASSKAADVAGCKPSASQSQLLRFLAEDGKRRLGVRYASGIVYYGFAREADEVSWTKTHARFIEIMTERGWLVREGPKAGYRDGLEDELYVLTAAGRDALARCQAKRKDAGDAGD